MRSMKSRLAITSLILAALALLLAAPRWAAEAQSGSWTLNRSEIPGYVYFSMSMHRVRGHVQESSDWPLSDFQGLDVSKAGKQDVKFTIVRDAGKFDCEGFLDNGEGAGVFHFLADPNYPQQMDSLGFGGISADKQLNLAILDVS